MQNVIIYSDGAARGNPNGPGGYGTVIQYTDTSGTLHEKELSEGFNPTTNNRMELLGAIAGLEALRFRCHVDLYSDSSYLINSFNSHWISGWMKNGWKTASGQRVKNQDLWRRLLSAMEPHEVVFHWVKGHNGHEGNERCDRLATSAADAQTQKKPNLEILQIPQHSRNKNKE